MAAHSKEHAQCLDAVLRVLSTYVERTRNAAAAFDRGAVDDGIKWMRQREIAFRNLEALTEIARRKFRLEVFVGNDFQSLSEELATLNAKIAAKGVMYLSVIKDELISFRKKHKSIKAYQKVLLGTDAAEAP